MRIPVGQWRYKTHFGIVLLVLGVLVSVAVFSLIRFMPMVQALDANDRWGPNPSWFGSNARYALQNDAAVAGAGSMVIPVYILNSAASADVNSKPPTDMGIRAYDFTRGYIFNAQSAVQFQVCNGNTPFYNSGVAGFVISRNCFVYDPALNGWRAEIRAVLQNNSGSIQFRLNIDSPNNGRELFGYSSKNGATAFALANQYRCDSGGQTTGCGRFYNFSIPFGTPCSVTQNQAVRVGIYDGDNVLGGQYNIQYNRYFSVQIYDVTTNSVVPHSFSGGEGNGQQAWYAFTVQPSHKYQFRIYNVYTNNVVQLSLPYDSVESIVDCSWDLRPSVGLDSATAEAGTQNIAVRPSVDNLGTTVSKTAQWQLSRCRVAPGGPAAAYSSAPDNTSNGVTTYNARGATCQQVSTGSQTFPKNTTNLAQPSGQSIGDEPVGTRICYVLSVNPPTHSAAANVWRHSTPSCMVIAKKPKVQVWGGDLIVGKGSATNSTVQTSTSQKNISGVDRLFGSWVEYGIIANGSVVGAASGSGYGGGATGSTFCTVSLLTFANAGASSCSGSTTKGGYSTGQALPNVTSRFVGGVALPGTDLSALSNGVYTASGNITLTASSPISSGRWVVINAPGATVTINSNISYTANALQSIQDIPQVIIIADNINIRGNVTNVDAWLLAAGTNGILTTCSDVAAATQLTSNNCNQALTVNGPVMARQLNLYRTAGSGTGAASGQPAEIFNIRPDSYLWATNWSAQSGRVQTVYTKELPPRF